MACRNCGGPHDTRACVHPCTVCFQEGHTADQCLLAVTSRSASRIPYATSFEVDVPLRPASSFSATQSLNQQIRTPNFVTTLQVGTPESSTGQILSPASVSEDDERQTGTAQALNRLTQQQRNTGVSTARSDRRSEVSSVRGNNTTPSFVAISPGPDQQYAFQQQQQQQQQAGGYDPYMISPAYQHHVHGQAAGESDTEYMPHLPPGTQHQTIMYRPSPQPSIPQPTSDYMTHQQYNARHIPVYRPPSAYSHDEYSNASEVSYNPAPVATPSEEYKFVAANELESETATSVTTTSQAQGNGLDQLPEYYHNILSPKLNPPTEQELEEGGVAKQMEINPVSNTVAERSSLLSVAFPFMAMNIAVLLYLFINIFWRNTTPGFPIEILLFLPVTIKLVGSLVTPQRPHEHVLVDGQNVVIFVSVYNESLPVLTKTLGSIYAQTFKSIALVAVVDHHADGLKNILELLEAEVTDGVTNPVTGDLEWNGIYDDQMPYTVIMKRQHSGKHGSECVFLRHLYKHCENFKYFVTVDGDTALHPDAISNLITHMEMHPETICSFGKVLVANDRAGIWAMTQALLSCLEFIVDRHYQSLRQFNMVTCAPGCFSCFRTDRIFSSHYDYWGLSLDSKSDRSYLWKPQMPFGRNLLLQEDRRRTSLLIKSRDPSEQITLVKTAIAETIVPTDMRGVVAKYRRRFASQLANDMYILLCPKGWKTPAGALSELHSLLAVFCMPIMCIYSYSSFVVAFKDATNSGFLVGLWLILLTVTLLFINGHAKYVLYIPILFLTAPLLFVYVPLYGVVSFTAAAWGTRGENTGVHPKVSTHVGISYLITFIGVLIMVLIFYCRQMDTPCYF
jgi:cellulose synthase/poly-beta-1,6-N-acetylglucosamine synthase-like glycosyltransferase